MFQLIISVIRWIIRQLFVLGVIVAILFVGVWLKNEWGEFRAAQDELEGKENVRVEMIHDRDELRAQLSEVEGQWKEIQEKYMNLDQDAQRMRRMAEKAKEEYIYWDKDVKLSLIHI